MSVAAGGFREQLMGAGIQLKLKKIRVGAQFSFFRKQHSTLTSFIIVFIWLLLLVVPSSVATAATALNQLNKPACLISFNRQDMTALPETGFEMTHPTIYQANLMPKYIYPSFQKVMGKGPDDKLNGVRIFGMNGQRAGGEKAFDRLTREDRNCR